MRFPINFSTIFSLIKVAVRDETQPLVDVSPRTAQLTLAATSILLLAMLFIRYVFAGATMGADNSSHLAEILTIAELLRSGDFDFWSYDFSLGYPFFIGYNALPYLIMGLIAAPLKGWVDPTIIYNGTVAILSALLPLSWYYTGRLLRLPRFTALLFSFAPLLLADHTGFGFSIHSIAAWGLFTQLWGMLVMPIAVANYYRLLELQEDRIYQTILWHSLLCSLHCLLGIFTGLCAFVWFLFNIRRWKVFLISQAVVLVLFSYWIYSYLMYSDYLLQISFTEHPIYGERSLALLLKNFVSGKFFSFFDRVLPYQTILLVVGILASLLFAFNRLRCWALLILGFALLCYFYVPGDSYVSGLLPIMKEIPARRYLSLMHFSGALLIVWAASYLVFKLARIMSAVLNVPYCQVARDLAVIVLFAAVCKAGSVASVSFKNAVLDDGFYAMADVIKQENSAGRLFVHGNYNTGSHLYRNYMTTLSQMPQTTTYARGVRDSLSFYYLEPFHFHPANFELYNIRYLVATRPVIAKLRPNFSLLHQDGRHRLYRADKEYGNFDIVRSNFSIDSFRSELAINFIRKHTHLLYRYKLLPLITDAPPDSLPLVATNSGQLKFFQSKIDDTRLEITEQEFKHATASTWRSTPSSASPNLPATKVQELKQRYGYRAKITITDVDEHTYVVLKASFHPNWRAHANGEEVAIQMIAPNYMAINLPAGRHDVRFTFHSDLLPKILFLLMLLAWVLLFIRMRYLRSSSLSQQKFN
ncbi:MAG: hypothetical protein OYH77_05840 [Pseudomonadota bacterium]|nr:hypothetical protein [Pseudomonadota bacterium]